MTSFSNTYRHDIWGALIASCALLACGGIVEVSQEGEGPVEPPEEGGTDDLEDGPPEESPENEVTLFLPHERPFGLSHPDWLASYWQWHLSMPREGHPREGGECSLGQEGDVWFLTTGHNGEREERSCAVPRGKAVLILMNAALLFPRPDCSFCTMETDSPAAWEQSLGSRLASSGQRIEANTAYLEIDGEVFDVDANYFWFSQVSFFAQVPLQDPYFSCSGPVSTESCGWSQGQARPFSSVGYAAMLHPLPRGGHVVRFGAKSPVGDWLTDVTYHLEVE